MWQSYYLFDPRLGAQMWQKDDLLIKNNAQEHYHIFSRPRLGFFLKALLMENIKTRITMASSIYTAIEGQLIYSFFPYRRLLSHFPVLVMASLRTASTCCFLCMLRASKNTLMYVQYEAMIRLLLALKLMWPLPDLCTKNNVSMLCWCRA